MYEPPNRGSKTWSSLERVASGGDDPGSITNPAELANLFLMPRGYTMVWSGWDLSAGTDNADFNDDDDVARREERGRVVDHRAGIRIHRRPGHVVRADLSGRDARPDEGDADASREAGRRARGRSRDRVGVQRRAARRSVCCLQGRDSLPATSTSSRTPRRIRPSTASALPRCATGTRSCGTRRRTTAGTANPLAGDVTRIYTEVRSQPGRMLNDFRTLGFNQAENGRKVFDGMLQWIAAGDGINMNYRFSQPGRTERNRQDHLYVEGVFPFANVSTTDPITGKTAGRYDRCIDDQHLSAGDGDLLGQRVLGEGRVAVPHRSGGEARSAGVAVCAPLFHLEPSARHGQR